MREYKATIGLEVHAQLNTKEKIFGPEEVSYGGQPNSVVSVITMGFPGVLPKPNMEAIEKIAMLGIACGCKFSEKIVFYRKSYFYPDLPKGYQITEGDEAGCQSGFLEIKGSGGKSIIVGIKRIHLEEDTGKSIHGEGEIFLDFNRAGCALVELVTEPCIENAEDAYIFLSEIRKLVRYLDICDGNMEEGSLRCDVNISITEIDCKERGKRVEIKNINSISGVRDAIRHEICRQESLLRRGERVEEETRGYCAESGSTVLMRKKDKSRDYRYYPEPNIPPIRVSKSFLEGIRKKMPLLPWEYEKKFSLEYGIGEYEIGIISGSKELAIYFEDLCRNTVNYKEGAKWILGGVKRFLNERLLSIKEFPISAKKLGQLIDKVAEDEISYSVANQIIFPYLLENSSKSIEEVIVELNICQKEDIGELRELVKDVMVEFKGKVEEYKKGKKGVLNMLVGEVIRRTKNMFNPQKIREEVEKFLGE